MNGYNHSPRPPATSTALCEEWPPDITADDDDDDQNLQGGEPENIPHPSQQQSLVDDMDFNLDSFLEADLNAMYAAQAATATVAAGSHSQEQSSAAGSHSQEQSQSHSVPLHHYDDHSHHSVDSEQQLRPHSQSTVTSSNYVPIPQVPSQPLSLEGVHTSVTPPLRPSCRFQVHYDRGEGLHVGYPIKQHKQYQFISQSPLQHLQHPLNIRHPLSIQRHHFSMPHDQPAVNFCPLHSNNHPHPFLTSYQHPALLEQPVLQQRLPQQPVPRQRLPQQPLPLHYHQAPLFHSHLLPQSQLPQQPVVRQPQSFVQQPEYIQPVAAKPTHVIFPPIVHQLQKKESTGNNKQALIPVHLPHTNNADNSKDSPDVPTTPLSSLTSSPLSSLPSTPYMPEPILSQPPSPAAFSPVPGPSGYNPNSSDPPIRVSRRNVDREGRKRLNLFADKFKETRVRYKYSKQHVAQQISIRYKFEMTELQLQRFENKALSFEDMLVMKIHLEKWLMDTLRKQGIHETEIQQLSQWLTSFNQKRKGRTAISVQMKRQLLKEFEEDPKPSVKALRAIAENLGIRFEVVRVWFCNRRAKMKAGKDNEPEDDEEIEEELD